MQGLGTGVPPEGAFWCQGYHLADLSRQEGGDRAGPDPCFHLRECGLLPGDLGELLHQRPSPWL